MGSAEDRQQEYAAGADLLNTLAAVRRAHERETPDCGAAPLCAGMGTTIQLGMLSQFEMLSLTLVAIGEISRLGTTLGDVQARLEVQRGITQDTVMQLDRLDEATTAQVVALSAQVAALEEQLGKAWAEITMWEEAADALGPVGRPAEED